MYCFNDPDYKSLGSSLSEAELAIDSKLALFTVEYDCGEFGIVALKQKTSGKYELIETGLYPDHTGVNKCLLKLEKNASDEVRCKEVSLHTFYKTVSANKDLDGGILCEEFRKILCSCGKDESAICEMATLIFGLLTAYKAYNIYYQLVRNKEKIESSNFRAPIFTIRYFQTAWDVLTNIIESICPEQYCVSTHEILWADLPRVISVPLHAQNLNERIGMSLRYVHEYTGAIKSLQTTLPAQYEKAAVLIDGRGFSNTQLFEFQMRNPWASQVFFRFPASQMAVDPLPLDARTLTKCSLDWDAALIQTAITQFSKPHPYRKKEFRKMLFSVQEKVQCYNKQHPTGRLIGQKKDKYIQMLLTVEYFADFVASLSNAPTRAELVEEWSYMLLPGCCERPRQTCPLEERTSITEVDYLDLWQAGVERLFSSEILRRYQAVGANEICDDVFPDSPEQQIWGYWRNVKKYGKRAGFRALYIPEQTLYDHFDEIFPVPCDCYDLLKYIRKHAPVYLHTVKIANLQIARDQYRQTPCVIFRIDDIPFLSDENRQYFSEVFSHIPGSN